MSIGAILAAIAAIGTIVGGIVYLVKTGVWAFTKTPEQKDATIDQQERDNLTKAEQDGRPH